ncbi:MULTISPECIES: hypothetical protein [unclassified Curtobacterium]|uniref:hypothetical protein n=1 Tax=unclassified Curtobacterium TaxID=257496 RepID=UPI0039AF742A
MSAATALSLLAAAPAAAPATSAPGWQTALISGGFLVAGAAIAFLSTWFSDRRKLRREDQRQWDAELKASYVAISAAVSRCHLEIARVRAGTSEERLAAVMEPTEEAMRTIREQVRLLELIAREPVIDAAKDVQMAIAEIWQAGLMGPTDDPDADEFLGQPIWLHRKLTHVDVLVEDLRARVREAIRIEPEKRTRKKATKSTKR